MFLLIVNVIIKILIALVMLVNLCIMLNQERENNLVGVISSGITLICMSILIS